jgi:hypothetical protein
MLDDADEPRAAGLLERWRLEFDCEQVMIGTAEGATAAIRPRPRSTTSSPA